MCYCVNFKGFLNFLIFCIYEFFVVNDFCVIDQNCDFVDFVFYKFGYLINVILVVIVIFIILCLEVKSFNFFYCSFVSSFIYIDVDYYSFKFGEFEC